MSAARTHGTIQGPAAAGALEVDRDAEPDVLVADHPGRARPVDLRHEGGVHLRDRPERLHHGPGDQVGEADLASGRAPEMVVDHDPVDLEKLGGNGMNARGGRHRQAGAHVLHDAGRRSPQRDRRRRLAAAVGEAPAPGRAAGGSAAQPRAARAATELHRRRPPFARAAAARSGGLGGWVASWRGSRRRTRASSRSPTRGRRDTTRTSPRQARRSPRRRPRAVTARSVHHRRDAIGGDVGSGPPTCSERRAPAGLS